MKRHWKKAVLALGIILLSTAGYLVYLFQFKEYDVADKEVDDITQEEYEVELPDGSTIILDKEGNVVENKGETVEAEVVESGGTEKSGSTDSTNTSANGSAAADSGSGSSTETATSKSAMAGASSSGSGSSSTGTSSDGSGKSATGTSSNSSAGSDAKAGNSGSGSTDNSGSANTGGEKASSGSGGSGNSGNASDKENNTVTVAQIKQKYEPALADVEAQASSRINGLIGRAKAEYSSKKANGESISYSYFYSKYTSAAAELENRTDSVFYAVLGSMKSDLKANGLAESHADSFVSEYENRKAALRNSIMKEATGF